MSSLISRAAAWVSTDPDQKTKSELLDLIHAAEQGKEEALNQLNERFCGPLKFGTAGIRGLVGAGESYMNVAVVTRVTYGLLTYLLEKIPDAASRGVSDRFCTRWMALPLRDREVPVENSRGRERRDPSNAVLLNIEQKQNGKTL